MTTNFVESKRQEFLNALVAVRPRERFKVVVVDRRSLKLLNRTLKLSEILEHDVARIEKIENNRKEDPNIEALYFLTPSKQSVDSLIEDFGGPNGGAVPGPGHRHGPGMPPGGRPKRPKYRAGHVYFTSELSDLLLAKVKKAGISQYIRALKELCIEYDNHGKRIFLTRMINRPLYRLYSPLVTRGFNDELELISKKLANVCGALKETPVVRYLLLDQETYGDTKARPLAFLFHTEMDRIRESIPKNSGDGPQTELIIVDRSADPFAPILHEFTYEAMVYDLLEIEDGCKYTYTVQLGNGEEEVKTIQLDDNDEVWQEFRYKHISEAQEGILKQFNELVGSNRAIADLQAGQQLNLNKMRDVIANMPQFKGQLSQLSAHITMMEKCMEEFKKRALNDLAMLEQNLVMGTTPDDEKYVSGDIDIADMLSNPDVEMRDKLRLLLIFFIANPSLTESERQKLASLARFSTEARETIKNMGLVLRWSHALDLLKQIQQRPNQAAKSKWALGNLRGANSQNNDDSAKPYDLSRYTPALKNVIEGSIEGYLSEDLFPYVVPPEKPNQTRSFAGTSSLRSSGSSRTTPTSQNNESSAPSMWSTFASSMGLQSSDNRASTGSQPAPAQRQIKSLRSGRPTWQKRESSPATTSASSSSLTKSATAPVASSTAQPSQGRVILFVIGGITFSEVRAAEEVSRKCGREVIIGSTHMIEPEDFLYEVSTLSFEIMGNGGRRIDIKPSLFAFGYGGPAEVDPLILYDGDADVPTWRSKPSAKEEQSKDQFRSHGSSSSESQHRSGRGHERHPEPRSHDRSRSRGHNQHPSSRSATPDYRSHGSAPPMQQQQQHRGGRPDPYHSSSSTSSSDYRRVHPGGHSSSGSRDHYSHGPRSSPHQGQMRAERSASPAVYRGDPSRTDGTQNFRAGYEEYKQQQRMQQQQQQQQVMRSKSSHASLNNSVRPAQPPLSKEDVFRAKFERSQQEWNAQRLSPAHVNPESIPDMHKISLNSSGRGRSGSSGGPEKPSFLKRYM